MIIGDTIFKEHINESTIEIDQIARKKSGKVIGYGLWLSQGLPDDLVEYWIPYSELDDYILTLQKARKCIEEKMK